MIFIPKSAIFVIILTTMSSFISLSRVFGEDPQQEIIEIMQRSSELFKQDPERYKNCFQKYIRLLNGIAATYETNFRACIHNATFAAARIDESTYENRYNMVNGEKAVCSKMSQCPEFDSVEKILECYANEGQKAIQIMYDIHANASEELTELRRQYFLITNDGYKCTNDTKRRYEKESTEKYNSFNDCISVNGDIFAHNTSTTSGFNMPINFMTSNITMTTSEEIPSNVTTPEDTTE